MRKFLVSVALMVSSGLVQAGLFDDAVARQQINTLTSKVEQLQKENLQRIEMLEAGNKRILDLVRQLDLQKEEIAKLRGQNEMLQFNLDEASKRQKDLYMDLDSRLRGLEQGKQQATAAAKQSEQQALNAAIELVKNGNHQEAQAVLGKFRSDYPQSVHTGTARYWLGMSQAASKNYKAAKANFSAVVATPDDPAAADALLGLASLANAAGDKKTSRKYLLDIVERYPQSTAADTAKKALTAAK